MPEFRYELFRLRAETPERPGDHGFLPLGRGFPCSRQARDDAVLVRRPSTDLGEGLGSESTEVIGSFRGRLEEREKEWHGSSGRSAENSQRPGGLSQSHFLLLIESFRG